MGEPIDYNSWLVNAGQVRNPVIDVSGLFPEALPGESGDEQPGADGTLPPDQAGVADDDWSDEQDSANFYTAYQILCATDVDSGLRGSPVATPKGQGKTAIWRSHGGSAMLHVAWMAERLGEWPICPHWDLQSPLFVLRTHKLIPDAPNPQLDSNKCYRVRGIYTYYLQSPPGNSFAFPVATTRLIKTPAVVFALGDVSFNKDLLAFLINVNPPKVEF